jgi:hypothetical protein
VLKDVADCPECGREGIGLVRPFHTRKEPPRAPKLAPHGIHDRVKGQTSPRCKVGTGLEVQPEAIYKLNKKSHSRTSA